MQKTDEIRNQPVKDNFSAVQNDDAASPKPKIPAGAKVDNPPYRLPVSDVGKFYEQ